MCGADSSGTSGPDEIRTAAERRKRVQRLPHGARSRAPATISAPVKSSSTYIGKDIDIENHYQYNENYENHSHLRRKEKENVY